MKVDTVKLMRDHGLRPSPQRVAVADYISTHATHPTVETVYAALAPKYPTLSKTTVYQTLERLCDIGAAQKITIEDGEMRFDADISEHGHFKCSECGEVFDLVFPEGTKLPSPPAGFRVDRTQLYFHGVCPACAENAVKK